MKQFFRFDRYTVYALLVFAGIALVALGAPKAIGPIAILVAVVGGYFLPTIIAQARKVPNTGSVFVINLFLGWTLIGWVVALAMAARSVPEAERQEQLSRQLEAKELENQRLLAEISQRPRRS